MNVILKILLIRHGESTGNRDHLWAGITDSELTNHGFLQAERLGSYLIKHHPPSSILAIYSSDLLRAQRTARAISSASQAELIQTKLLREQDLGWREGRSYKDGDRSAPENSAAMLENPGESKADMDRRAAQFIDQYLQGHIHLHSQDEQVDSSRPEPATIIVVSHGLFLLRLYYRLTERLGIGLPPTPTWSNTGCTELCIKCDKSASVTDVNSVEHLKSLKRTRAGVGSAEYDTKQKKVSDFFGAKRNKNVTPTGTASAVRQAVDEQEQERKMLEMDVPPPVVDSLDEFDIQEAIRAIDAACS